MRRIALLAAVLSGALVPCAAAAQHARGAFVMGGRGGGGTELLDPRFSVDAGYTIEAAGRRGPYVGGRYTLGMHRLRADQQALRERYGDATITVEGGGGTLYDTGVEIEIGYGLGVVRVYGFTGMHYYQQYQEPATIHFRGGHVQLGSSRPESISGARGYGVNLRLTRTGAVVAEHYRGGGQDGIIRISGTRFGLRWAW
ncbi:MAG: hypothetical protein KY467_17570 [Gemmatimonadetes bacterium]|nr:hypothetical protein [Gemmatimonadota bacterium]